MTVPAPSLASAHAVTTAVWSPSVPGLAPQFGSWNAAGTSGGQLLSTRAWYVPEPRSGPGLLNVTSPVAIAALKLVVVPRTPSKARWSPASARASAWACCL